MAWLAEQKRLMDVAAISSVSGGSIFAALYYLHVKHLLEATSDADVQHEDYIEIVQTTQRELVSAVQTNLRLRTFDHLRSNLRMFRTIYSRTDRLGDLLEASLYKPAAGSESPVRMADLAINPRDGELDNDARHAKLPDLIINATVLQTGRRWEFTPVGMGEPPYEHEAAVGTPDALVPFRPYGEFVAIEMPGGFAPPSEFEVGYAVAASAAVPGIFHPMTVSGVTPEGVPTPLLVDGGVIDNQGVDALISRDMKEMVAIDAGGQLTTDSKVRAGALTSLLRSSDIQYGRVRFVQLARMYERGAPFSRIAHIRRRGIGGVAAGSVRAIRTDLDAFSDVEIAYLMRHGYRAAAEVIPRAESPLDGQFAFNDPGLDQPSERSLKCLNVGRRQLGKVFYQSPTAWAATIVFGAVMLAIFYVIGRGIAAAWPAVRPLVPDAVVDVIARISSAFTTALPIWVTLVGAAAMLAGTLFYVRLRWVRRLVGGIPLIRRISWDRLIGLGRVLAAVLSWVFVKYAIRMLNPLFLRAGRLDRPRP